MDHRFPAATLGPTTDAAGLPGAARTLPGTAIRTPRRQTYGRPTPREAPVIARPRGSRADRAGVSPYHDLSHADSEEVRGPTAVIPPTANPPVRRTLAVAPTAAAVPHVPSLRGAFRADLPPLARGREAALVQANSAQDHRSCAPTAGRAAPVNNSERRRRGDHARPGHRPPAAPASRHGNTGDSGNGRCQVQPGFHATMDGEQSAGRPRWTREHASPRTQSSRATRVRSPSPTAGSGLARRGALQALRPFGGHRGWRFR